MKRSLISLLAFMLLIVQHGYSQKRFTVEEDFDGISPAKYRVEQGTWLYNTDYYQPSLTNATVSRSFLGRVPDNVRDTAILEFTNPPGGYDFLGYNNIELRFSHICKVSPYDIAKIQYKLGNSNIWYDITPATYLGNATNYTAARGFNAASYTQWDANDSTAFPTQDWWREEVFDLSADVSNMDDVVFRFIIIHGDVPFTEVSLGWLLENIQIRMTDYITTPPVVQFTGAYPKDTVYNTGPWEINAKIKTSTDAPIRNPELVYTVTEPNKQPVTYSLPMEHIAGDSLWKATIPRYIAGTEIEYSITGRDTNGNEVTIGSEFYIKFLCVGKSRIAPIADFLYTGDVQEVELVPGIYNIECWGADGGSTAWKNGGKGGYSSGILSLDTNTLVYIYVGEQGKVSSANPTPSSFGGGGSVAATNAAHLANSASGGGASDVRVLADDLYNRIIVAGGGGGANSYSNGNPDYAGDGGHGGGTDGNNGEKSIGTLTGNPGYGGTQTAGGAVGTGLMASGMTPGTFGAGGNNTHALGGNGGGGGWYGGGSSSGIGGGGAGGGSGYVLTATSYKPIGYFAQQAAYQMENPLTAVYGTTGFETNPTTDKNGHVRITTISISGGCQDYVTAIHSIDIPDTVGASPTIQTPIVATIHNTGVSDLDSVIVSYSINNSIPTSKSVYFSPALSWDFKYQDTIDYYYQKVNAFDTIVVWVSLPNGQVDTITSDDTLTKIVYGTKDILVEFVDIPVDTVYTTAPQEIMAKITSLSGASINQVLLNVTYTHENTTTNDVLSMTLDASDNLWKIHIPQKRAETDITYTLNVIDKLGNTISLSGSYYIAGKEGEPGTILDYSAELSFFNISDTLLISPYMPIVTTIKNTGELDLDYITVSYSVNNSAPVSRIVTFNPALPWDFTSLDTINYYAPKVNGLDTVVVWISLPNGEVDMITYDDTLSKISYGMADIFVQFVDVLGDTVYNTGPFEIKAKIESLSGMLPATVSLNVSRTYQNSTASEVLSMQYDASDNLWKTSIPQKRYETDVTYSINLTDIAGNTIELSGKYYIEKSDCGAIAANGAVVTVTDFSYTGNEQAVTLLPGVYELECWGAEGGVSARTTAQTSGKGGYTKGTITLDQPTTLYLYVGEKGGIGVTNGPAPSASWNGGGSGALRSSTTNRFASGAGGGATDVRLINGTWNDVTSLQSRIMVAGGGGGAGTLSSNQAIGGHAGGLTGLVGGNQNESGQGGTQTAGGTTTRNNAAATNPGSLGTGGNGVVGTSTQYSSGGGGGGLYGGAGGNVNYGNGGGGSSYITGYSGCVTHSSGLVFTNTTMIAGNASMPNLADGRQSGHTGNGHIRITPVSVNIECLNHSIALESINSPNTISETEGISTPVHVSIRNKGVKDLDSCYLNWSLNGVVRSGTVVYRNIDGLPEDFTDTITIGSYIPVAGKRDTIVAWVSMPNSELDSAAYDDTLSISPLGCTATILAGTHLVGTGGTFANLDDALTSIRICGIGGDLTLQLKGNYGGLDLSNISDYTNGHTLTITSYANHADSAVIKVSSGAGILLNNSNDVIIKAITVDAATATATSYAVQFTGACTNVMVRDCKLLTNATATVNTIAPVYKANTTGIADNISFINNVLDGGYYGIYFYGGTGTTEVAWGTNVIFDSNTVSNQYYYGAYIYYTDFETRHNTFTSRSTSGVAVDWQGIYMYYANGNIIGNHIMQRSATITTPVGINLSYVNYYPTTLTHNKSLIANNEIIIRTTSGTATYSGIHVAAYTNADILHNSIYVGGTAGRGIHVANSAYTSVSIKNNNIVMEGTAAAVYAINLASTSYFANRQWDVDFNNMYTGGTNIGYAGAARATIAAWRGAVTTDSNSVSELPAFIATPTFTAAGSSLSLLQDVGITCPEIASVPEDISGTSRNPITTMGCYAAPRMNGNVMLTEITGLTDGISAGQTEDIKVVVHNTGVTTLTEINLEWSINGQSQGSKNYPVSLPMGDSTTITVAPISYPSNNIAIKVWVNNLNNGTLPDEDQTDDTLSTFIHVCRGSLSGEHTIGTSSPDFADISSVITYLNTCGISGKLTLKLEDDTYLEKIDLSTIQATNKDTIEIVSLNGNTANVIIQSTEFGIKTGNLNNVSIKNITINTIGEGYGILMGEGSNIEINGCIINLDTTLAKGGSAASSHVAIYKPEGGIANNGRILNNTVTGGYNGITISAGNATTYGAGWMIDNNSIQKAYSRNVSVNYTDFLSISNNISMPMTNTAYTATEWFGLSVQNSNAQVIQGNKIHAQGYSFKDPHGMFFQTLNANTTPALICNNEIILAKTDISSANNAFTFQNSSANIYHNSIYVTETDASSYSLLYLNTSHPTDVRNNNLIATYSRPVYVSSDMVTLDHNNYYTAGTVLGNYKGTTAANLIDWQTTSGQDANSVSLLPQFNVANGLELSVYNDSLDCPWQTLVSRDIRAHVRTPITTMGAYHQYPSSGLDLMALEIHLTDYKAVNNKDISVTIDVLNLGSVAVNDATLRWKVNGQVQPTTISHSFTPSLASYEQQNIQIGTFKINGNPDDTIDVVVWIETINTIADSVNWNDTISASAQIIHLTKFVDPLVGDTISSLSFDVYASIFEKTGAPVTAPEIYIQTTMMGGCSDSRTIPMTKEDGKWVANIPKQYFGSKVVYELHVSDNIGNNVVLKDSTFIQLASGPSVMDYPYTGNVQTVTLPKGKYQLECWGANGGGTAQYPGGKGGYSKGTVTLKTATPIYIYAGEGNRVDNTLTKTFGGGGWGYTVITLLAPNPARGSGGGASDVRVLADDLYNRIIVAGGGGGTLTNSATGNPNVSHGGGLIGDSTSADSGGLGGTQTKGGASNFNVDPIMQGSFGIGGDGTLGDLSGMLCGGGGGWYGGGGGNPGGGGSGYVLTPVSHKPVGYFPAHTDYYLSDAITIKYGEAGFVANPDLSGNGYVRISVLSSEVYDIPNNLAILNLVSPANDPNAICNPDSVVVEINLTNIGENDYDFTLNNLTIGYEITNPRGAHYRSEIGVNTGELLSGDSKTIEIMSAMPVLAGTYTIKTWVTSAIDNFVCDDTLLTTYTSTKTGLPIQEDFSEGIPAELIPTVVHGNSTWEWYGGSTEIQPDSGTGMIRFAGTPGSIARLSSGQLDLFRASNPFVEFWYYHDTATFGSDYSNTKVKVRVNDAAEYDLATIYVRDPNGKHGWTYYKYLLNQFTTGNECILIQFVSTNSYPGTVQYIDYVQISSELDAAVSEIIVTPEPALCSRNGSDISVVIEALRAQFINFGDANALILDINGTKYPVSLQGKVLQGNTSERISVLSNFTVPLGTTVMKAYFSSPVDNMPANDTAKWNITIEPKFEIKIEKLSGSNPATAEFENYQKVFIKNTGNMELQNIGLILTVDDESGYHFSTKTTVDQSLSPSNSIEVVFPEAYKVPWSLNYTITVHGYLSCDSALVNTTASVQEEANITDLYIVDIISPSKDTIATVDSLMEVSISVRNRDLGSVYDAGVKVWLLITDTTGMEQQKIEEELPSIAGTDPLPYTFTEKYTIPALSKYHLTVYIENKDSYAHNDTVRMVRQTKSGGVSISNPKGASFTMEQNIPNPAKGNTIINYSIPQDGEIVFKVYSASGQLLYTREENLSSGKHQIKLNLSDYASGVYFYTMEYKGQRISKRMSIAN